MTTRSATSARTRLQCWLLRVGWTHRLGAQAEATINIAMAEAPAR